MAGEPDLLLRHIRGLVAAENPELPDQDFLRRVAAGRDEAAFEVLLQRHGPMVLRVCRNVLRDPHAAEDAFQATFIILFRKASSVRKLRSVGSWLYKVAYRTALRARAAAARRKLREAHGAAPATADPLDDVTWRELQAILHDELQRLAEKYRAPVVLCCLEGRSRDEAAAQLGWSLGALKGRLERGRELLRARLVRRCVTLSAAVGATLLSEGAVNAAVPAALAEATVRSALAFSAGAAAAGAVSAEVTSLARGMIRAMFLNRLKVVVASLLVAGIVLAGAGKVARAVLAAKPPGDRQEEASGPPTKDAVRPAPEPARVDRHGDPLPAGAVERLGTLRFRHMHTITSVAYSQDGKALVSSSWDGTVRLWDAEGRERWRFTNRKDGFSSAAISPDGAVVAGGDMGRTLFLWDAATGKELGRVEKLENTVFGLRFSPDGKKLAGVSGNTARVWDVATREERGRVVGPKEDIRPFAFAADLKTFAAGHPDHSIHVWDLEVGKEVRRIPSGQKGLMSLALSPDGKTLASGGTEEDRTVRVWDLEAGEERHRFGPFSGWVESVVFSPDGKALAAGEQNGAVHVYDVAAGKELCQCGLRDGTWVRALTFSPDGKTLAASGTDEKSIRFFAAATGKERHPYGGHQNEVTAAAVTPDGKALLSAGKDGAVCRWDLATGKEVRRWVVQSGGISAAAVAPDGRTLVTAGGKALRLWDADTGAELRRFTGLKGTANGAAFSPDGKTLAAGGWEDHVIGLWDVGTAEVRLKIVLPMPRGHNYGDLPLAFSRDGKVLISGSADRGNPTIYFWDTATGKELRHLDQHASRFALSPDGKTLATASWDKRIHLWDVTTAKETRQIQASAEAVAFSPDGRTLAYGGTDGVIHVWEVAANRERCRFSGHQSGVTDHGTFAAGVAALAFTPDGRTLISGGGDTTLLLWDALGVRGRAPEPTAELWADLADGAKAGAALGGLIAAPAETVPFLKGRLAPVAPCDARRVERLIADLDSDDFAARERATEELTKLRDPAAPALRKALAGRPPPEVEQRLKQILQQLEGGLTPEQLRDLRAVEALEHIGTPEARRLLAALAKGAPEARLTREAAASLERLDKRGEARPSP
jgi:RNA polymerase sigma factor (sigma-70 family)